MAQGFEPKRKLIDLPFIRVTSWRTFEECPYTWAQQYLCDVKSQDSVASKIGTAVHSVMEHFQLSLFDPIQKLPSQEQYLSFSEEDQQHLMTKWLKVVPEVELTPLHEYMDTYSELLDQGYMLMALEEEVEQLMPGVPVPIRGHIDARWLTPTGAVMIDDHKTNRSYDPVDFWREQLQQMLYAWMTRSSMAYGQRLVMRIGYPNLGRHVEWETDPSDDIRLIERVQRNWALMQKYEDEGVWPRRINDKCKWCPVRSTCPEYATAIDNFNTTFKKRMFPLSLGEQLEFVQNVKKLVEGKEEELKAELATKVAATPGGRLRQGDLVWFQETGDRRSISAETAFRIISKQVAEVPELGPFVIDMMDEMFTAKVGGIDKLIKKTQAFGELTRYITKKPNSAPTLKSVPAGKLPHALLEKNNDNGEPF